MLLHGVGSNEVNMTPLAQAADERFAVISVRAPLATGPKSYAWFPVQFTDKGPLLDEIEAERSRLLLLSFIEEYRTQHNLSRVFLLGFSQGAIMAAISSTSSPESIRGAVCMSGRFPPEFERTIASPGRLELTRLLVTHGVEDTTLPIRLGRNVREVLGAYGLDVEYLEYDAGHTVTEEMITDARVWLTHRLDELENSKG